MFFKEDQVNTLKNARHVDAASYSTWAEAEKVYARKWFGTGPQYYSKLPVRVCFSGFLVLDLVVEIGMI